MSNKLCERRRKNTFLWPSSSGSMFGSREVVWYTPWNSHVRPWKWVFPLEKEIPNLETTIVRGYTAMLVLGWVCIFLYGFVVLQQSGAPTIVISGVWNGGGKDGNWGYNMLFLPTGYFSHVKPVGAHLVWLKIYWPPHGCMLHYGPKPEKKPDQYWRPWEKANLQKSACVFKYDVQMIFCMFVFNDVHLCVFVYK